MDPTLARAQTTDGITIAYPVVGSGPTLVHLPGVPLGNVEAEWRNPGHRRAYLGLASRLRFVQYDGRGTGRSQRDVEDLSLEGMVRDLEAVVGAIGGTPITILGFYFSCSVAIAFAARHPEHVSGLVLFGGSLRGWDAMSGPGTQALLSLIEQDWDTFVESAAHAWLGWPDDAEGRLVADSFRTATTPAAARAILREASRTDVTLEAGLVRCPALVLHRTAAPVIPLRVSEALAAALPQGRLELIDGSSANLFSEHADDLVQRLVELVADPVGARVGRGARSSSSDRDGVSARELEVLKLIAAGESNAEIANHLGLSINTVERHVTNLYRKIDARSRADATAFAIRRGLA